MTSNKFVMWSDDLIDLRFFSRLSLFGTIIMKFDEISCCRTWFISFYVGETFKCLRIAELVQISSHSNLNKNIDMTKQNGKIAEDEIFH